MPPVSLKDRLKQFQALKTSAQLKSQAVLAREKELQTLSQQSPVKPSSRPLKIARPEGDDSTAGGETYTTAGETAPTIAPPPPLSQSKDDADPERKSLSGAGPEVTASYDDRTPKDEAHVDESVIPIHANASETKTLLDEEMIPLDEKTNEFEETKAEVQDGTAVSDEGDHFEELVVEDEKDEHVEDQEVEDEEEVVEEVVEIVEEVEGDTEDTEEIEIEEFVEVVEEEDDEEEEEEEVELTEEPHTQAEVVPEREKVAKPMKTAFDTTDEKSVDEFSGEPHPVMDPLLKTSGNTYEEAPMDEMEFIREIQRNKVDFRSAGDEDGGDEDLTGSPFDEDHDGILPVFDALDEEDGWVPKLEGTEAPTNVSEGEGTESDIEAPENITEINDIESGEERVSEQAPKNGLQTQPDTESGPPPKPDSGRVLGTSAPEHTDLEQGNGTNSGHPKEIRQRNREAALFNDKQQQRWKCVVCFLLVIGACAITALVLPFVLDYDDPKPSSTQSPTISPLPTNSPTNTPTLAPTVSSSPTRLPTNVPTGSPTFSMSPSIRTTRSPTRMPSIAPTKSPTNSPVVATIAPADPTQPPVAPTPAPVPTTSQEPTTLRLGNFIDVFLVPISGEEVFEDRSTPQYQAAHYIAEVDEYSSELTNEEVLSDRYGLITFYFATGGDSWNECFLGDETCTGSWLTGDACQWKYLSCNEEGRVVSITFDGTNEVGLSGFIPKEIYAVEELEEFIIIDEPVGGTLPEQVGKNATHLRKLVIQETKLSGSIPNTFLHNSPLESLVLSGNSFGGSVPVNVGTPSLLLELDLGRNGLEGTLPESLGGYENLSSLTLVSNLLEGSIPESLYGMSKLEMLDLGNNRLLSGELSAAIGSMATIKEFRVDSTAVGGILPDELFSLATIEELDLSNAAFRGPLSSAFEDLSGTLKRLHLQNNEFTGTVPGTFGQLDLLNVLNLEGNDLVGSIAPAICMLRGTGESDLKALSVDCDEVSCTCCTQCFR